MEILLENEDRLNLSWDPGCYFDGSKYTAGAIGRRGANTTDEDLKKPWICSNLPSALHFHIRFKNIEDIDLFKKIKDIINNTVDGRVDIRVVYPKLQKNKFSLKDEYKEQVNIILEENEKMKQKYLDLIKQLNELGCECNDCPSYKIIPNEWYNCEEYEDATKAGIDILCHDKTQIYIFLKENGILDKYFPEWYKLGNF